MIDAVADVYLGVSHFYGGNGHILMRMAVHILERSHISWRGCVVLPAMAHGHFWL